VAGWFRLYDELLDDPKVQKLSPDDFRSYVNLLCLANRNDGRLPEMEEVSFALRVTLDGALTVVERLVIATLIDKRSGGANGLHYAPHGWQKRQYKSDTSAERTRRYRKRHSDVTGDAPEQSRAEQSIPLDKSNGQNVVSPPDPDKAFWELATGYLGPSKRSVIGKWVKDYGRGETARAIAAAQVERAVDPVPYVERCLRGAANGASQFGQLSVPC